MFLFIEDFLLFTINADIDFVVSSATLAALSGKRRKKEKMKEENFHYTNFSMKLQVSADICIQSHTSDVISQWKMV